MIMDPYNPCDIDRDKDCDGKDYQLFIKVMGQCDNGNNYNEIADADHDGCITYEDQQVLFPNSAK